MPRRPAPRRAPDASRFYRRKQLRAICAAIMLRRMRGGRRAAGVGRTTFFFSAALMPAKTSDAASDVRLLCERSLLRRRRRSYGESLLPHGAHCDLLAVRPDVLLAVSHTGQLVTEPQERTVHLL